MSAQKNQPFVHRVRFALAGLAAAWRSEPSFRLQSVALASALVVLLMVRPEPIWWAMVALSSAVVMAAELLNTALEEMADHLHPHQHPRIRVVKDCAAAAVFVASCGAVAVAIALLWHLLTRG